MVATEDVYIDYYKWTKVFDCACYIIQDEFLANPMSDQKSSTECQ